MSDRPQPTDAFEWVQGAGGPALVCRPLAGVAPHVFTTRAWRLGSFTVAARRDGPNRDDEAWAEVAEGMGVAAGCLARATQVHGSTAVPAAAAATLPRPNADIIVSGDSRFAVAVQAADCLPLLVADPRTGAVAAAHAGWRGLASRVPQRTVEAMQKAFGVRPADLIVAVGPSVGACCYEVGAEVRNAFAAAGFAPGAIARWFLDNPVASARNPPMAPRPLRPDHWFFDGWCAVRDQLAASGLTPANVHVAGLCTASHPSWLCSYRREGSGAGRIAGAIRSRPRP